MISIRAMDVQSFKLIVLWIAVLLVLRTTFAARNRLNGSRLSKTNRPNILLILTDDQDVELGSMEFMPKTLKILRDEGVEFTNGFVTTPLCCPSRSTILTGLYVHNHHVHSNNENCTGQFWINEHEPRSIAVYLNETGYRTGYFGKYLNQYNGSYVPRGWQEWMGLIKNSRFYNYTINFNGNRIKHGDRYDSDYFTDLIVNDSLTFIRHSYMSHRQTPVFCVLSFPAPHGPEDPAPRYSTLFANVTTHRTPSWNYAPNPDKQWILQHTGKMEPVHVAFTDFLHRRRLQTLLSVDDGIERVVDELRSLNMLDNTLILFTSDHGYHLGQFGLIKGKTMPYDFDLKVPFFVRGPGIGRGLTLWQPVANIDVAPTILDAAGVAAPRHMDGRSILPLLKHETMLSTGAAVPSLSPPWRHTVLVERGLRPKLLRLRERLQKQRERYTKDVRIQSECERSEYQPPCKPNQRWECRKNEVGRWRIFKCRGKINVENDCTCNDFQQENTRRRKARDVRDTRLGDAYASSPSVKPMLLSDWEQLRGNRSRSAFISEKQLERWETEFLEMSLTQENDDGTYLHWKLEDCDNDPENVTLVRMQRNVQSNVGEKHKRRHRTRDPTGDKKSAVMIRNCVLYVNSSVHCRPEVYRNFEDWKEQKYKVDDRIRNLRSRLQELKGLRQHLNKGKPPDQVLSRNAWFWTSANDGETDDFPRDDGCDCAVQNSRNQSASRHPLSVPVPGEEVTNAELLAIAEERRRKKLERKRAGEITGGKKAGRGKKKQNMESKALCNVPNMDCFTHDNHHWKTPPYWTLGPFCFCQNSNNNTYWCMRTVNATHDFLYCEFVTGFISFYDMTKDKYQLNNVVYELSVPVIEQLSAQLEKLRNCRGSADCELYSIA